MSFYPRLILVVSLFPASTSPVIGIALSRIAFMYVWGDMPIKDQLSEYDFKRFLEYNGITEADLPEKYR